MKSLFRLTVVDAFCAGTIRVASDDVNGNGTHHMSEAASSAAEWSRKSLKMRRDTEPW